MNDDTLGVPESVDDLTAVRDVVLRAHPDTVPELIAGESISALLASVEPAREAYRRVLDTSRQPPGRLLRRPRRFPRSPPDRRRLS